jgi:phosphonate transport system substrate-binding protein
MSQRSFFSVCPHDTAKNLVGWYVLNSYMQRKLQENIHFEPAETFTSERAAVISGDFQIVYANPYSALLFAQQKGFVPVARVAGLNDETLLVSRRDRSLPAHGEVLIASATDQLIVHPLGETLLTGVGLERHRVRYRFVGTHLKAAQEVLRGEADAGYVFNETWRGLANATRDGLQVLAETHDGTAFHCFCVGPGWADRVDLVRSMLLDMNTDAKGQDILAELGFARLEAIDAAALTPAAQLLRAAESR